MFSRSIASTPNEYGIGSTTGSHRHRSVWGSFIHARQSVTIRVGMAFLAVAIGILATSFVSTVETPLKNSASLFGLISIAFCAFAGLFSMRTSRVLRNVEDELLRFSEAIDPREIHDVARTPRRILADDPVCDGWNRLLDLALANVSSDTMHRAIAPLDREAVTLARAMRALPVAWVITDTDARIRFISPVALGMLGLVDGSSCENRHLTELLGITKSQEIDENSRSTNPVASSDDNSEDEADNESELVKCASDLEQALGPIRMVTLRRELSVNGSTSKLRIVRSRLGGRGGDGAGLAWVIQDVTQQQLATEARDQFLMTATHEFRTPLTNLQAYAEALSQQETLDLEHQKEFCNIIYTEANRLGRLVDHLLTVSQLEAGSIVVNRHELDLLPLLEQVLEQNRSQAEHKQIVLTSMLSAKLPTVIGDRDKLQAAIINLVGNAIKYSNNGGNVTVKCEVEENWIRIDVNDQGDGIPIDEQERVFDKFFRGQKAVQSSERGNGLGLAFSREIARLHQGEISLQSIPGQGSTFTMRLPIGGQSRSGI